MKSIVLAVFMIAFAAGTLAAERMKGDVEVALWGASHHLESAPAGYAFDEWNPGIGARYFFASHREFELFFQADYILRNSTGGGLAQAGVGVQYPIVQWRKMDLLMGAVAGVARYENKWEKRTFTFAGGYPFVGLRYEKVAIDVGYIPKISRGSLGTYPAVFTNLHFAF